MFFIDILIEYLSTLLPEDDPEYKAAIKLDDSLLDKLQAIAGEDLVCKLMDAERERCQFEYRQFFLWGLRLGVELLRLQGG